MERERKKALVREELRRAALQRFRERGFETTTIDEIADAAGVSRRTFFRYFECKEAVVFDGYADRLARFRELLAGRAPNEQALDVVRRASLAIAEVYMEQRRELLAQWKLVQASPALAAYELELDRGWLAALVDAFDVDAPPYEARLMGGAALGVTRAALSSWFEQGGKPDLVKLGEQAFDLLERGFVPARRRR